MLCNLRLRFFSINYALFYIQSDCNKQYYIDGHTIKFGYDPFCGSDYENDIICALRTNNIELSFNVD